MKQLIKTGWLLITPPSTTDFLGIVSLNLASLLPAVFVRLHVGDLPSTGLGDGPLALVIPLGREWFLKTIYEYQIKVSWVKFCSKGREPWSSSYGKRLTFRRLWVRIPAQYACCKDCTVCLKRPKINQKSQGMGHFKKKFCNKCTTTKNKRRRRPSCRPFKLFRLFGLFTRNFSTQNHPLRNFLLSFFLSFFLSLLLYFSNLVFLSILFLTFSPFILYPISFSLLTSYFCDTCPPHQSFSV